MTQNNKNQSQDTRILFTQDSEIISNLIKQNNLSVLICNGLPSIVSQSFEKSFKLAISSENLNKENENFLSWLFIEKDIQIDELRQEFLLSQEQEEEKEQ